MMFPWQQRRFRRVHPLAQRFIKESGAAYLDLANVVGLGYGAKNIGGRYTKTPCITFFVEKKLKEDQLKSDDLLPPEVDAGGAFLPTDVLETGPFRTAQAHAAREDPVHPGVSISGTTGAGTFGGLVVDNDSDEDEIVLLSNRHVIVGYAADGNGGPILQPGAGDGGQLPQDRIGTVLRNVAVVTTMTDPNADNEVDAAIGTLSGERAVSNQPHDDVPAPSPRTPAIGLFFAWATDKTPSYAVANKIDRVCQLLNCRFPIAGSTVAAEIGMLCQKTGRTTGSTWGVVVHLDCKVFVLQPAPPLVARFVNQTLVTTHFENGDSGSILVKPRWTLKTWIEWFRRAFFGF